MTSSGIPGRAHLPKHNRKAAIRKRKINGVQTPLTLKRMLPPNNMAIRGLSQAEGISEAALHKWRAEARGKGQLLPHADAGPKG